jgi:hypothetical protein
MRDWSYVLVFLESSLTILLHLDKGRTRLSDAGLVWGKPMSKSRLTPGIFEQGFAGVTKWGGSSRLSENRGLNTLGVSCRSARRGTQIATQMLAGLLVAWPARRSWRALLPLKLGRAADGRARSRRSARLRRARSARLTLKRARWGEPVGGGASVEPSGQGGQFGWFWGEIGVTEVLWGNWARK